MVFSYIRVPTYFRQDVGATQGTPIFRVADPCHLEDGEARGVEDVEDDIIIDFGVDCKGIFGKDEVVDVVLRGVWTM